jgi:hypothetical protein
MTEYISRGSVGVGFRRKHFENKAVKVVHVAISAIFGQKKNLYYQ